MIAGQRPLPTKAEPGDVSLSNFSYEVLTASLLQVLEKLLFMAWEG